MRTIIDGKLYDTGTARYIGQAEELDKPKKTTIEKRLYKKEKNGEFFLMIVTTTEEIAPMTFEETKKWVESNMNEYHYEQAFGSIEE